MSCIYGPRQMGTEDQGWVAHFLIRALEGQPISVYGDGRQVRDILHVDDAIDAYMAVWRDVDRVSGRAFNLGGGPANAVSLRQLLAHIEELVGRPVPLDYSDWRAGDQRYFVADTRRAGAELGLRPARGWREGVAELAVWLAETRGLKLAPGIVQGGPMIPFSLWGEEGAQPQAGRARGSAAPPPCPRFPSPRPLPGGERVAATWNSPCA